MATGEKDHMSVVICGHVDSGERQRHSSLQMRLPCCCGPVNVLRRREAGGGHGGWTHDGRVAAAIPHPSCGVRGPSVRPRMLAASWPHPPAGSKLGGEEWRVALRAFSGSRSAARVRMVFHLAMMHRFSHLAFSPLLCLPPLPRRQVDHHRPPPLRARRYPRA